MNCAICEKPIKNKKDLVIMKTKGIVGIEDNKPIAFCKSCIVKNVLNPYGFKDFSDYLKRYLGC